MLSLPFFMLGAVGGLFLRWDTVGRNRRPVEALIRMSDEKYALVSGLFESGPECIPLGRTPNEVAELEALGAVRGEAVGLDRSTWKVAPKYSDALSSRRKYIERKRAERKNRQ